MPNLYRTVWSDTGIDAELSCCGTEYVDVHTLFFFCCFFCIEELQIPCKILSVEIE